MKQSHARPAFTMTELVAVLALLTTQMMIVMPGMVGPRALARQLQCQNKQKELALAINLYENKYKRLPPSCHTQKYTVDGTTLTRKDGYSFLVACLPELEQESLWKRLSIKESLNEENDRALPEGDKPTNQPNEALAQSFSFLRCPEAKTQAYVDMEANEDNRQAITNYKAVSASTRKAYEVSSCEDLAQDAQDIYGTGEMRKTSDGAIYVGSRTTLGSISDGTTNTFLLTETEEPVYSRWVAGQECGLYTMNDDMKFSPIGDMSIPYTHPVGYTINRYGSDSTIPKENRKTNLNRNYTTNPYPWSLYGFRSERYSGEYNAETPKYGPGASHKGVITHAFISISVTMVSRKVDAAAYFFLTTRNGCDPAPELKDID